MPAALKAGADRLVPAFFEAVVRWQRQAGRQGLPWQGSRDPYRVWLSEIMLQQTQVSTVLDYYPRFLQRFADVQALAAAPLDEVMALWSGLGYYSRARHLHRCAQQVVSVHGGRFPASAQALQTLPGIGASTAAAIAAFCHGERVSILDGNVKRVLARVLAFGDDIGSTAAMRVLWSRAQALLPARVRHEDMAAYTQGLMDLGAGPCARRQPRCGDCPVQSLCEAQRQGRQAEWPVRLRRAARRTEEWFWLLLRGPDGRLWLQPRPAPGIWAGLMCVPVCTARDQVDVALQALGLAASHDHAPAIEHPAIAHALTHRDLVLRPMEWRLDGAAASGVEASAAGSGGRWVHTGEALAMGLPAPLRVWLQAQPIGLGEAVSPSEPVRGGGAARPSRS